MENQGTVIQLSLWESIAGLLCLSPVFIAGLAVTGIVLYMMTAEKEAEVADHAHDDLLRTALLLFLCIVFCNIVGTPSLSQLLRTASYGESTVRSQSQPGPVRGRDQHGIYIECDLLHASGIPGPSDQHDL